MANRRRCKWISNDGRSRCKMDSLEGEYLLSPSILSDDLLRLENIWRQNTYSNISFTFSLIPQICRAGLNNFMGEFCCLFHKEEKNPEEVRLFWKVINYCANDEIDFTEGERQQNDFEDFKQKVEQHRNNFMTFNGKFYNFKGFIFPEQGPKFSFINNRSFRPDAHYNFSDANFGGRISFEGYTFEKDVNFSNATFQYGVSFKDVTFQRSCYFNNTIFGDSNIMECFVLDINNLGEVKRIAWNGGSWYVPNMRSEVYRNPVPFDNTFEYTKFEGKKVLFCLSQSKFSLQGATFSEQTELIIDINEFSDNSFGEVTYRIAKNQAQRMGNYNKAGDYFIKERKYHRYSLEHGFERFFDGLMDYITGYGEKPHRIIITSIFFIIGFWIYFNCSIPWSNNPYASLESLTLSILTFTTLGIFIPNEICSTQKFVLSIESLIGAILIALFVVAISKKYSRY